MTRRKQPSTTARLKRFLISAIDKSIYAVQEIVHEKRCTVCTAPFIPHRYRKNFQPWTAPSCGSAATDVTDPHRITHHALPQTKSIGTDSRAVPALILPISYDEATAADCFCPSCVEQLARTVTGHCPLCGELSLWPLSPNALCLACLTNRPPWESALFHGPYEGLLRKVILAHKFSGVLPLGHALGRLLAQHPHLKKLPIDAVIPVPLHQQRLQQRGYNQSMEIARGIIASSPQGVKLLAHCLHRVQPTLPQMGLSHTERRNNVRGVFTASPACRGRRILLVDDVYTTGSTLRECAAVLKKNGATSVHIAIGARTRRQRLHSMK